MEGGLFKFNMRPHMVTDGGGGPSVGLDLIYNPIINDFVIPGANYVAVNIEVDEIDMTIDPDGYGVSYLEYALDGVTPNGPETEKQIFYKTIPITAVECSGNTIVYTSNSHPLVVGDYVTIDGPALVRFNVVDRKVTAVSTNTFTIERTGQGATAGTLNTTANARELMIIKNLGSGVRYDFFVQPFKGNPTLETSFGGRTTYTNYITKLLKPAIQNKTRAVDPNKRVPGKSYVQISNIGARKNEYQFLLKDFESVTVPEITKQQQTVKKGTTTIQKTINVFDTSYYAFGTSMLISNSESQNGRGGGGLGFFMSGDGTTGYYIVLDTGQKASDINDNELRIVKVRGSQQKVLKDTQNTITRTAKGNTMSTNKTQGTLANTQAGKIYNISVKVQANSNSLRMIVEVNGFKVNVYDDIDFAEPLPTIIAPSKGVGLFCTSGQVMFDYAYAKDITAEEFKRAEFEPDFYSGQFSNDFIDSSFGNLIYNQNFNNTDIDEVDLKPKAIDEFGTTAREIYKLKSKFENVSKPSGVSLGNNTSASILSTKFNNFEAEVYVLNNASTTIPLEDSGFNSLFVWGNEITRGSVQEYLTVNETDFSYIEPITFEAKWVQNEEDAKSLADWIKKSVINKGKVVEMEVFGNPLISVGDIVNIKYTYQGMLGTEKFIITKVTHSFNQGLVTNLTCRSL